MAAPSPAIASALATAPAPAPVPARTRTTPKSDADLLAEGFSAEQIAALAMLRDDYPFVEFTDSSDEWRRLHFLKWRIEHGRLAE